MVPVLNSVGTHCAVFGNHDFGKFNCLITNLSKVFFNLMSIQIKQLHKRLHPELLNVLDL